MLRHRPLHRLRYPIRPRTRASWRCPNRLDGRRRSKLIWNAVAAGVVVPLGRLMTGTDALFKYLRQSVIDFDTLDALRSRLARTGFAPVTCHAMGGWQRGIVHTLVAHTPSEGAPPVEA